MCFAETIKLGHGNGDQLGNQGGHAPTMEIISVFKGQMTVKDGLVLSVDWSWRDTQSSLGLCFSFGRTIKGGMDGQLDLAESSELGVVHTC